MAVVRARSAPPYALITFIALWVVSTVLAVLFYLNWAKADVALNDQAAKYTKVVKLTAAGDAADITLAKKISDESQDPSLSYIRNAQIQIDQLKTIIVGNSTTPFGSVLSTAAAAQKLAGPTAQPLVPTIGTLVNARDSAQIQLDAATKALAGINGTIAANSAQALQSNNGLEAQLGKTIDELSKAKLDLINSQKETVAANENAQKLIGEMTDRAEETHRGDILAMQARDSQINKLQLVIKDLQARIPSKDAHPYVGEPDGQIVRVNQGAGEAYINLNISRDRMSAGMTFAVYDPRTGVRFGDDVEAQGKGSIEVIEPGEVNSLVRITRQTKGQTIASGDLIANQVYQLNKNRQFHFVVFGDFDLDGDGIATAHERERLESLIVSWGGVIDPEINSQTDYVVTGAKPKTPSIAEEPPTTGSASSQRAVVRDAYDDLIIEAKRLSIPVLNANRFLSMIGYYSTTIVRH